MEKTIAELKRLERKLSKLEANVSAVSNLEAKGTLIISDSGGKKRFFRYLCKDEPLEYLGKSKNYILKPLAQKRYDTQLLNAVKKQKKAVDFCIKKLEKVDFEDLSKIYNDFPAELKQYIKPHLDDDEQYAAKWQAKNYGQPYMFSPNQLSIRTGLHSLAMCQECGINFTLEEIEAMTTNDRDATDMQAKWHSSIFASIVNNASEMVYLEAMQNSKSMPNSSVAEK